MTSERQRAQILRRRRGGYAGFDICAGDPPAEDSCYGDGARLVREGDAWVGRRREPGRRRLPRALRRRHGFERMDPHHGRLRRSGHAATFCGPHRAGAGAAAAADAGLPQTGST